MWSKAKVAYVFLLTMVLRRWTVYSKFYTIDHRHLKEMVREHILADTQSEEDLAETQIEIQRVPSPCIISRSAAICRSIPRYVRNNLAVSEHTPLLKPTLPSDCVHLVSSAEKLLNLSDTAHHAHIYKGNSILIPHKKQFVQPGIHLRNRIVKHILQPKTVTVAYTLSSESDEVFDASTVSLFKIVPVTVSGPKGKISVYALLDDGASETMIDKYVADYVGSVGPESIISVKGVGGMCKVSKINLVSILIKGVFSNETFGLTKVCAISNLNTLKQRIKIDDIIRFPYLRDIANELSYKEMIPTLIIGVDNHHLLLPRELRLGAKSEPAAIQTALGWAVFGKFLGDDGKVDNPRRIYSVSTYRRVMNESEFPTSTILPQANYSLKKLPAQTKLQRQTDLPKTPSKSIPIPNNILNYFISKYLSIAKTIPGLATLHN